MTNFEVHIWNRSPHPLPTLTSAGAVACESTAELAGASDIIMLCLANTNAVESVIGQSDFIDSLDAGKIVVDLSSISPDVTRSLAGRIKQASGTPWLDAPVSGGVPGAETGELVIMVGGDAEILERVRPVLSPLSQRITHMGPVGAGQTAKLCNQIIVGCNITAIGEAFRLAREAGVDSTLLPEALQGGFADSLPFQIFGPRMANRRETPVSIKIETMLKDLRGAADTAADLGVHLALTRSAATLLQERINLGDAQRCITSMVEPTTTS